MATRNVLAAVDFSNVADEIVRLSSEIARSCGAMLWIVHVEPEQPDFVGYAPGPQSVRDDVAHRFRQHHRDLETMADRVRADGTDATALLLQGVPAEKIKEKAREEPMDLIVIGSHGHGAIYDLLVGSVCQGVLKDPPSPVLVVPAPRDQ